MAKLVTIYLDELPPIIPIWDKTGDYWTLRYKVKHEAGEEISAQEAGPMDVIMDKAYFCATHPEIYVPKSVVVTSPEWRKSVKEEEEIDRDFFSLMSSQFPEYPED